MAEFITEWIPDAHKYKEEIVRCRDCKHAVRDELDWTGCVFSKAYRDPFGFCAWGEREES